MQQTVTRLDLLSAATGVLSEAPVVVLPVPRPVGLADGVRRRMQLPIRVGIRCTPVGFAHNLRVHPDGTDVPARVVQCVEAGRRNSHRRVVFGEPAEMTKAGS